MNNNKMLSDIINQYNLCSDMLIESADKKTIGDHHVGNFMEALDSLKLDFIVSLVDDSDKSYIKITLDEDYNDDMEELNYISNNNAIKHDKYFGDGKYCKDVN